MMHEQRVDQGKGEVCGVDLVRRQGTVIAQLAVIHRLWGVMCCDCTVSSYSSIMGERGSLRSGRSQETRNYDCTVGERGS